MQRAPFLISATVVLGVAASAVHVMTARESFAADAGGVVGSGLLVFALITAGGLLLSRGRWSRRLAVAVVVVALGLAGVDEPGPWAVAAVALNALALFGLSGPWLRGWLRSRPSAMGPGTRPLLVLLGAIALIPGTGMSSPGGLDWQHWTLLTFCIVVSWGYSRASAISLWALRVALFPVVATAATGSPAAGAAYLIAHGAGVTFLAWGSESRRAVRPLIDRVYGARAPRPLGPRAPESP